MMTRLALIAASAVVLLFGCNSDPVCPVGFFPSGFGGCLPFDAADAPDDSATSDLGDGGVIGDVPAGDTADDTSDDTAGPDVGPGDTPGDLSEPDLPERDVPDRDLSEPDACTPNCDGLECGPDGCGGSCGTCRDSESCADGLCKAE